MAMKVAIVTMHAVKNYGSALQTFATQELFKQYGCEVEIVNYVRKDMRDENLLSTWCNGNPIKMAVMLPTIYRWKKVFGEFYKNYLNVSDGIFSTEEDFVNYPLDADLYCTGSDQAWNSKWNKSIEKPLYLSFVPANQFKFSFSASFGQEQLEQSEIEATAKYINQYRFVSVRESSGKKIIEEQYGYPVAYHLIDPTLALSVSIWKNYATPRKVLKDYILIYNLNRSKEFDNYAVELSKRTGLELVRFCTRYDQFYRPGRSILVPEIFDFISLIGNARFVLTDSFHATAFSMNMNVEPICVYPSEFAGRLGSFLELSESTQCHVNDYNDFDVVNRRVDFDKVNSILERERNKVNDYLTMVFTEAEKACI